jgi:UDP-N-acetylglucosamine 4-epimerase
LAACASDQVKDQVYNVAVGDRTTLNDLYKSIASSLKSNGIEVSNEPVYRDFRAGDVRHSQADISKAQQKLGYDPKFNIGAGIDKAMPWYIAFVGK